MPDLRLITEQAMIYRSEARKGQGSLDKKVMRREGMFEMVVLGDGRFDLRKSPCCDWGTPFFEVRGREGPDLEEA